MWGRMELINITPPSYVESQRTSSSDRTAISALDASIYSLIWIKSETSARNDRWSSRTDTRVLPMMKNRRVEQTAHRLTSIRLIRCLLILREGPQSMRDRLRPPHRWTISRQGTCHKRRTVIRWTLSTLRDPHSIVPILDRTHLVCHHLVNLNPSNKLDSLIGCYYLLDYSPPSHTPAGQSSPSNASPYANSPQYKSVVSAGTNSPTYQSPL